jgi:hypothetical protein
VGWSRASTLALAALLVGALALRLSLAVALPNIVWPDEIYQTLEPAHGAVFGPSVVPWEFRTGARSWVLPGFLAGAMELGRPFGRLGHLRAAQAALAVLSLVPVAVAFAFALRRRGLAAAIVAGAAAATWFELVFFSAKALNEVVGAHALVAGLWLATGDPSRNRLRAAGLGLGLAVALRIHLAPAVAVAVPFLAGRAWSRWRPLVAGGVVALAAAGLLDLVTWGAPFHSFWMNVRFNVLEGGSARFGVMPWDAYLRALAAHWSWVGIPLLALAILGAIRWPAAGAAALAILVTHTPFAHKEYRFLYPFLVLAVVLAAVGLGELVEGAAARRRAPRAVIVAAALAAWLAAAAWGGARFRTGPFGLARGDLSMWRHARVGLLAMERAGADPALCGVGVSMHWAWTGGYTWLHRDVPIVLVGSPEEVVGRAATFNAAIVHRVLLPFMPGWAVEQCWGDVCLARRAGGCTPDGGPTVNQQLIDSGA